MPKRTFNPIQMFSGIAIVVMVAVGVMLTWAHSSIANQVHNELAVQKIFFPAANSPAIAALPAPDASAMIKYAGQIMTTGTQAETYADHYEWDLAKATAGGQTFAQLLNAPKPTSREEGEALFINQASLFRDQAIVGELLDAYKYSKIGQYMLSGAFVAFIGAAVVLLLLVFGLARRVALDAEALLTPVLRPAADTA